MTNYTRREFIRAGLLASGALLFPLNFFSAIKLPVSKDLVSESFSGYKAAKDLFYRKEYASAEQAFKILISQNSRNIINYDGLAKTYYAQNRLLEAAESYRQGWILDKTNPLFSDRFSRALMRLATGNIPQAKKYSEQIQEADLLQAAEDVCSGALKKPTALALKYLDYTRMDIRQAIGEKRNKRKVLGELYISEASAAEQTYFKGWRALRERKEKIDFLPKTETQADIRSRKIESRQQRQLYFEQEKQNRKKEKQRAVKGLYYSFFIQALKNGDISKVEKFHGIIVAADKTDSNIDNQLVHFYRSHKQYAKLTSFLEKKKNEKQETWATISYAQALKLQAKQESNVSLYTKSLELYKNLGEGNPSELSSNELLAIQGGVFDCLLGLSRFSELRTGILNALSAYPLSYLPFVLIYIKSKVYENETIWAEKAYSFLLEGSENIHIASDPIYPYLKRFRTFVTLQEFGGAPVHSEGYNFKKHELLDIYYAMAKLYEKTKDSVKVQAVVAKIRKVNPKDPFIKKRSV